MPDRSNSVRLDQVAHYVIARVPPGMLGTTKLSKILWFIDCYAYRKWGRSLTGLSHYIRLANGPVPTGLGPMLASLKSTGKIVEDPQPTPVGTRREFLSLVEPDLSGMTAPEIDLIHVVIDSISRLSAREASDLSHDALWEEVATGSSIPVAAGALTPQPMSEDALVWAKAEVERLRL